MKEIIIKDGKIFIAKILKNNNWPGNLNFYSDDKDFLQVSTWNYNKGKHLKAHGHKIYKRTTNRTSETIYVKNGKMLCYFYNEQNKLIKKITVSKGDIVMIYAGGHAYDILENKTQILEVKNGPYPGLEKDKKIIEV